jgi:DNA-binding MarR family transcriptional regulator
MSTARDVRRAYDRRLRTTGVNLKEASVLAHLADAGSLTQVELANRIGVGRANVGVVIDALESRSLVRRDADPTDRRVWLVRLTPDGERVWRDTVQVDREIRKQLRLGISPRERDELDEILMRIHVNVQSLLDDDR